MLVVSIRWPKRAQSQVLQWKEESGAFRTKVFVFVLKSPTSVSEVMDVSGMRGLQLAAFAAVTGQSKRNWGGRWQDPDFAAAKAARSWSPEACRFRSTSFSTDENEGN